MYRNIDVFTPLPAKFENLAPLGSCGPDSGPISDLIRGEIEFGTTWLAPALIAASRGAELCPLSQVIQRNGLLLAAIKEKGFQSGLKGL